MNQSTESILHVMNGHTIVPIFADAHLPGTMTVYPDPLHEGPVPGGLSDDEMREARGRFLASDEDPWQNIARTFGDCDVVMARAQRGGEVVFWFEHDLFDQLLLIRHLARLEPGVAGTGRVSLICIDRFPGIEPFLGLGQLNGEQFASLFPTRAAVTAEQIDLARRAWNAFTAPDPQAITRLLATDTHALPFLHAALERHLQQFPSHLTGLPATEQHILDVLAGGSQSPAALFRTVQQRESCFFIGDTSFRWRLDELAAAPHPLIAMHLDAGDAVLPPGVVTITADGRDVLAGRGDWLSTRPFDRWLGGVHVHPDSRWRWDGREVRTSEPRIG